MMVGFTLLMLMPLVLMFATEKQSMSEQIAFTQARQIASKIADSAETVYYLGESSLTTIRVYVPSSVDSIELNNYEAMVKVKKGEVIVDIVALSSVNMTGSLTVGTGIHEIQLTAMEDYVNVTQI